MRMGFVKNRVSASVWIQGARTQLVTIVQSVPVSLRRLIAAHVGPPSRPLLLVQNMHGLAGETLAA